MMLQKRWNFGLGTIFSLIVVYFVYLYSRDKKWLLLAFAAKWYLIIFAGLIALPLMIILLVVMFSLLKRKKKKDKNYIEAEYRIKE